MASSVVDAVLFSQRGDLKKAASEQLKMKGVSNLLTPEDPDECVDGLERFPGALLILDHKMGAEPVAKILGADRRAGRSMARPILLVADQVDGPLVATAAEYGVSQIYTDAIDRKSLGAKLASLLITQKGPDEVKKGIREAVDLRNKGQSEKALEILQGFLEKHSDNAALKVETAETLLTLDRSDEALPLVQEFNQAPDDRPPYLRGIHLHGRCLMKAGRYDEAHAVLERANLFNPNDVERLCDMGHVLLEAERFEEAKDAFDKAVSIDDTYRPAKLGQGQSHLMDGDINQGLSLLREIAGNLELASMFNTTAVMNMRKGRHQAGMRLYQAAVKALGSNDKILARLWFNMGIGYRRWGKDGKAKECFDKAVGLDESFAKAKEHALAVAPTGEAPPPAEGGGLSEEDQFPEAGEKKREKKDAEQFVPVSQADDPNKDEGESSSAPVMDFSADFSDFGEEEDLDEDEDDLAG